jgi:hypothetical protein
MCDGGFFGWMDKMGWVGVEYGASDWGMENVPEPQKCRVVFIKMLGV